jgi:hypothetical protein
MKPGARASSYSANQTRIFSSASTGRGFHGCLKAGSVVRRGAQRITIVVLDTGSEDYVNTIN